MRRHRRVFLGLAMSALVGLMTHGARAETITMTITANGVPIVISGPPGSPASLVTSSTSQSLQINTANLNTALTAAGSHYQFSDLGVVSNWPGTSSTTGAFLKTAGTLILGAGLTPDATPLTIVVTEDGFTAPIGSNARLTVTSNANYAGAPAGSTQTNTGSYNAVLLNSPLPTGVLTSTGTNTNNPSGNASVGIGTSTTGFTLDNRLAFSLLSNPSSNAADAFAITAQVQTAVPEPESLALILTGMPVTLVVMGLLRRRRRASS